MRTNKPKRGDAFEQILNRRIEEALGQRQRSFPQEHETDSDEALLRYVRAFAEELGRAPNSCEIIGGTYLKERFGSWERLLELADLPVPGRAADFRHRLIYKQERERQLKLWREEKARKQAEKALRQQEKAQRRAEKKANQK